MIAKSYFPPGVPLAPYSVTPHGTPNKIHKTKGNVLMKKLASLLLALVMILSCVPAMAAGEGSITVDNAAASATYTAYKIFDVVYNESKTAYAYTINSNSPWYSTVNTFAATEGNGMKLTASAADSTVYIVEITDDFSAAKFAVELKKAVEAKTGITLTVADGKATATGLDLGYYFVTTSTGALCNLTTTDPSVTIHDKNDVPFDKVDNASTVEIGDVVTYTIKGKVPDTTGFTTYTYEISDTMSAGLTFNKDVAVTVGDTTLAEEYYTLTNNKNGFNLEIEVMKIQAQVTKPIVVTYTATVNDNAVANIENNKATLTYSNDPTDSTKKTTTPEDMETVYTAKIVVDKYANDSKKTKLAGATFVLYKNVDNVKKYYKYTAAVPGTEASEGVEAVPASSAAVTWVDTIEAATSYTTDATGKVEFKGLADGEYFLHETAAPAGYNLLKEDVKVTINGKDATVADKSTLTVTSEIANNTGAELPSTGGMGTTLLYVGGGILVLAAIVLLIAKRRVNAD